MRVSSQEPSKGDMSSGVLEALRQDVVSGGHSLNHPELTWSLDPCVWFLGLGLEKELYQKAGKAGVGRFLRAWLIYHWAISLNLRILGWYFWSLFHRG